MTDLRPPREASATAALEAAIEEMKVLMVAIATRERSLRDKDTGDDFLRLKKELLRYDKIVSPPDFVRKASDAWAFWREVSQGRGTYEERRAFIEENFTRYYSEHLLPGEDADLASFMRARDLELGQQIGGGGFGDVYRAKHRFVGSRAVKVFRPHFYDGNREALVRFNREARILARLAHPNIVRFFDAGVAPGPRPFIVTEFIEGQSLENHLRSRPILAPHAALDVCEQLLDALGSAHTIGVVHRDIKPNNIMWTDGAVTLLDLGSGGIMSDVITTRITNDAQGTVGYMAPELIDDPKLLDPRTDLYSVGVLLHRLLTGRSLQPGDPGHYLIKMTISPPSVLDVLRRAVAPAPQRFQTSQAMLEAVREIRAPVTGVAARPSAATFLSSAPEVLSALGRARSMTMPPEWLQWARDGLIGSVPEGDLRFPLRVARVIAVLAEVPQALGDEPLDWVGVDDVESTASVILGLIDGIAITELSATVSTALDGAVRVRLIQQGEYDAHHRYQREKYSVTPLGKKTLSDAGFAIPPPRVAKD